MKAKDKIIFIGFILVYVLVSSYFNLGCPIRLFTGLSCPGCGISRAWISVLHGSFREAFHYHPLFLTAPFIAGAILFEDKLPKKARNIFWYVIGALFVICYIIRIAAGCDVLTFDFSAGIVGKVISGIWNVIKTAF